VYSVEQDKSYRISDGLSDVTEPNFDKSGKYLYFFASTDAGPSNNWFSLENRDNRPTRTVWLTVLRNDLPSPLTKESDEEKGGAKDEKKDEKKEGEDKKDDADKKDDPAAGKMGDAAKKPAVPPKPPEPVRIDFEGIANRIVDFPIAAAEISSLASSELPICFAQCRRKKALRRFDLKDRATETLLAGWTVPVSQDGKRSSGA
jgi:tricorn protease